MAKRKSKTVKADDGRRLAESPGVYSYRVTNAEKARIIDRFTATGSSVHSRGETLGVILEHCRKNDIDFELVRRAGFYRIVKLDKVT